MPSPDSSQLQWQGAIGRPSAVLSFFTPFCLSGQLAQVFKVMPGQQMGGGQAGEGTGAREKFGKVVA